MPISDVAVFIASCNTADATELCVRTARRLADYPFRLVVGDSGSTDGSLTVLADFEQRKWLTLETRPGSGHTEWLDKWHAAGTRGYAVFVDSDVEFRRRGWLRELVTTATRENAALVCAEILPETPNVIEPVGRVRIRAARRPSPWLMLVDVEQTREVDVSFQWYSEQTDRVPEGVVGWDTGGRFLEELDQRGLRIAAMPRSYQRCYHHYGGMSWIPLDAGHRGRQKELDLMRVRRHLARVRREDGESPGETTSVQNLPTLAQELGLTALLRCRRLVDRGRTAGASLFRRRT